MIQINAVLKQVQKKESTNKGPDGRAPIRNSGYQDNYSGAYLDYLNKSMADATNAINISYDNLIKETLGKKGGIISQADTAFSDTYSNARVSAIGNNEVLALKGLSSGLYKSPSSGYSESSRIATDNQMNNGFSRVRETRDNSLNQIDVEANRLSSEKLSKIAESNSNYSKLISEAYYKISENKRNQDNLDREFTTNQLNKDRDFNYMSKKDDTEFSYKQYMDNKNSELAREQEYLKQNNFLKEFDYKTNKDKENLEYKKEQDKINNLTAKEKLALEKEQQRIKQENFLKEYNLKLNQANKSKVNSFSSSRNSNTNNTNYNPKIDKAQTDKTEEIKYKTISQKEIDRMNESVRPSVNTYTNMLKKSWDFPTTSSQVQFIQNLFEGKTINRNEYNYLLATFNIPESYLTKKL